MADDTPAYLENDEGTVSVLPLSRLPDMGHCWEYRGSELAAKFVESFGSRAPDCYLCREGCCVRRHFYFADSGHMVVHGAYEA
jgi:hypothetical protein